MVDCIIGHVTVPPPQRSGGLKAPSAPGKWLVFLMTSPPPAVGAHSESPHQHNKDTPITQEIPRVLEAPCQGPGARKT